MSLPASTTKQQLRDSISCPRKRNEVPERPKETVLVSMVNSSHCLSIERECEIAGKIVFVDVRPVELL